MMIRPHIRLATTPTNGVRLWLCYSPRAHTRYAGRTPTDAYLAWLRNLRTPTNASHVRRRDMLIRLQGFC